METKVLIGVDPHKAIKAVLIAVGLYWEVLPLY
jgi:hypothetical protein